jgi:hypothetical protein
MRGGLSGVQHVIQPIVRLSEIQGRSNLRGQWQRIGGEGRKSPFVKRGQRGAAALVLVIFGAEAVFQPGNFILDIEHPAFVRKHVADKSGHV